MQHLRPVDRLVVDVALDNLSDNYSSKPHHVSPEFNNVMAAGASAISGRTLCCAQLGLALVLTAYAGPAATINCCSMPGPRGHSFSEIARIMGVSLADVEAIALSHGHWDHMGALLDALDHITRHNQGHQVPCHVNPGMFLERGARLTTGQIAPFEKVPTPEELAAHGAQVVNSGEARLLLEDCFYLSGEIPRVSSFEKGRPDHLCRQAADQPWEPDPLILDERYVAVNVHGKGLIVFSSCSHAGIVNVLLHAGANVSGYTAVRSARWLASGRRRHGAVDSRHHGASPAVRAAADHAAHCTGWRALWALLNTFGESVVTPSAVGSRFTF